MVLFKRSQYYYLYVSFRGGRIVLSGYCMYASNLLLFTLFLDSIPSGMNNSVIQCSFFSCVSSSAAIILIGQPDTPVLNLVSAALTSVTINISPGNTRGSPVSKIRISLPLRVYSSDIVPPHWSDFAHEMTGLSSGSDVLVSVQCWNGYKWSDAGTIRVDTLSPPEVTQENSPTLQTTTTTITITTTPSNNANQSRSYLCVLILAILAMI